MTHLITQDDLYGVQPFAYGGSSELFMIDGVVAKVMTDHYFSDVINELYLQKLAANAGLAPQVHAISELDNAIVISMDRVPAGFHSADDDEDGGLLLHELADHERRCGFLLYCGMLKAGVLHCDFHSGNWFINGNKTIAIDFGMAYELKDASLKAMTKAVCFIADALMEYDFALAEELAAAAGSNETEELRALLVEIGEMFG